MFNTFFLELSGVILLYYYILVLQHITYGLCRMYNRKYHRTNIIYSRKYLCILYTNLNTTVFHLHREFHCTNIIYNRRCNRTNIIYNRKYHCILFTIVNVTVRILFTIVNITVRILFTILDRTVRMLFTKVNITVFYLQS